MGLYRDAVSDSHHSLELNPQDAYAYANLGYSHEQLGDLAAMQRDFQVAAKLNPRFSPTYNDAAARHGLEAKPISPTEFLGRMQSTGQAERDRLNSFLFLIVSSLLAVLIALGFLRLGGKGSSPFRRRLSPTPLPQHPEGRTVTELLAKKGRLSLQETKAILKPVYEVLESMRRQGATPKSVSPDRILVTPEGQVRLLIDFDSPSPFHPSHGENPEVFAFASCLYEMLTGRPPYPGRPSPQGTAYLAYVRPTGLRRDLPESLNALLELVLHPEPDIRKPSLSLSEFHSMFEQISEIPEASGIRS